MNPLSWNQRLNIPFPSINEEHQLLFDLINEFYNTLTSANKNEQVHELLERLKTYALAHFKNEEALMACYNYPKLELHEIEHRLFLEKINELESRFSKGKLLLTFEMTNYLKEWITHHVDVIDREYSEYIQQKIENPFNNK